jgi:multidrug resistance protein MdtO
MQSQTTEELGWREFLVHELAPNEARLAGSLRTALAAVLAALLMLILQTPWVALGCYMVFLVSYESPYLTFKSGLLGVCTVTVGFAFSLAWIIITRNDPVCRVLGIAAFTFIAGFFSRSFILPVVAQNFGIVTAKVVSLWDMHRPAEKILHTSMWPISVVALSVGCAVAVEYLFTRRDPVAELEKEIQIRFEAMEQLFQRYCEQGNERLGDSITEVRRYAFAGQTSMQLLRQEITLRRVNRTARYEHLPVLISNLTRLLELVAAFALHHSSIDENDRAQADRILRALTAARSGHLDQIGSIVTVPHSSDTELTRIEQTLRNMAATSHAHEILSTEAHGGNKAHKPSVQWLAPDAFSNPNNIIYAVKLSICATLCYVLYNIFAWPGISTAVLTVLITGLSTTGASNQKMLWRIIGSTIGGVLLGYTCLTFVFPNLENVSQLLVVIAIVSFFAAWVARSPHISYVGLQIAFSFYIVAFTSYSIPTKLEPGRDRVIGIVLGFLVMWAIFHQFRPERAIHEMRRLLVRILSAEAEVLDTLLANAPGPERSAAIAPIRRELREAGLKMRTLADAVPFEFTRYRQRDIVKSEKIQAAVSCAGNLLLDIASYTLPSADARNELREFGEALGHALRAMAAQVDPNSDPAQRLLPATTALDAFRASSNEHIRKALTVIQELESECQRVISSSTQSETISDVDPRSLVQEQL